MGGSGIDGVARRGAWRPARSSTVRHHFTRWYPARLVPALVAALALAACGRAAAPRAPSAEELRALLDQGPGRSVAVTARNGRVPALRPWALPAPRAIVQPTLERVIRGMPRWKLAGSGDGVIWAERRTLVGLTDDVYLLCSDDGDRTIVEVRSVARLGPPDFGRNRRNIVAVWTAFQAFMEAHHPPIPPARTDAVS